MPETEAEQKAIWEQLERILSSPLFKNSKQYPNLLRFVVERSQEEHAGHLKERTLGVEILRESEIRIDFPPGTYLPEFRHSLKPALELETVEKFVEVNGVATKKRVTRAMLGGDAE